jgi:glycine/D-amino acid oxidase-like deaminating enzyme
MSNVAIIGAGVSGSVIARVLSDAGHKVAVIDDARGFRATPASAGIIHPNWVGAFDKGEVFEGLKLLDKLYGLRTINFGAKEVVNQLSPKQYLWEHQGLSGVIKHKVAKLNGSYVILDDDRVMKASYAIICTGCWANELAGNKIPEVRAAAGTAFLYEGMILDKNSAILKTWAPYKQLMVFNRDSTTVWAGDGTSILPKNYTHAREMESFERVRRVVGFSPTRLVKGYRPTVVGQKGGVCDKIDTNTWVVTGGSKNGTIFAAIAALRLLKEIK